MYIIKDILNKENYLRDSLNQVFDLFNFTRDTYEFYELELYKVNIDNGLILFVGGFKNLD